MGTQLPLWYSKQCPCASYYHNYHNHPLYHFSPFWSWKRGKNLIKHQSYFSGWTTRHHHNHRSHSPDFNTLTDSIGLYISNFFRMSFSAGSFGQYNRDWINTWTIFYWAWWISWSPFVGVLLPEFLKDVVSDNFYPSSY